MRKRILEHMRYLAGQNIGFVSPASIAADLDLPPRAAAVALKRLEDSGSVYRLCPPAESQYANGEPNTTVWRLA